MNWLRRFMAPWVAREIRKRGRQMNKDVEAHRVGSSNHGQPHYMNRPGGAGIVDVRKPK